MYQTMKTVSRKRMLPAIISMFVLFALLLASTGFGIVGLIFGPSTADEYYAEDILGKYVSFDASSAIAAYASLSSSDSYTAKMQYYVLSWGDKYISVTANEDYYDVLDAASDQAQEYYLGDLTELSSLGTLTGTVVRLDSDLEDFMISGITGIGIPGAETEADAREHVVGYTIKLGYAGTMPKVLCIIVSALALICAIIGAVALVLLAKGYYYKKALAVVGQDKAAEEDFAASAVHDRIRVGKRYCWCFDGRSWSVLRTADIIWGYCEANPLVVSKYQWPVALYTQDKTYHVVHAKTKDDVAAILKDIADCGYPFVEGYSSAKNKLFKNEFPSFMELAKENKSK